MEKEQKLAELKIIPISGNGISGNGFSGNGSNIAHAEFEKIFEKEIVNLNK